ncbi:MAG: type I DNA topoisomerase [Oscillospiraceae bacterium]|nr:type I DNA topoisomerase [Oscillospiraceae bacterium]
MSTLVIVESPAKVKTIKKYLGKDYEVMASMGHLRDLPQSSLGVDVNRNFRPQYIQIMSKSKLIKDLKSAADKSDHVILATDPDREGEAIAWHLASLLKLPLDAKNRVTFGEITKKGVEEGMKHPRSINVDLFDAQQARRVLDRLVGYKISPFLWKKIRRGLSAGRVQSVTVRLLVDREREIEAFIPKEYWTIEADLQTPQADPFTVKLRTRKGVKPDDFTIENQSQCEKILGEISGKDFIISELKSGVRKRQPEPPFITSTLQQEASRRLGFTSRRTMSTAQTLYEGVDVAGIGQTGLITYMRTDSLRISEEASNAAREYLLQHYGQEYVYKGERTYKRKQSESVQDAHEAIRPTNVNLTPDSIRSSLSDDQYKLYKLIWERFLASRMADQNQKTVSVDVEAGDYLFRASGYTVTFDGFAALYEAATDEKKDQPNELPALSKDTPLTLDRIRNAQKFTQPPQRYTEAALIKTLEENGIGRPSTYAPTISTIIERGYVERDAKSSRTLRPTPLGMVVTDLMIEEFPEIVDEKFSAQMEKNLDNVEAGKVVWTDMIRDFYVDFEKNLLRAEQEMDGKKIEVPAEETDVICEKCGRKMVIKSGKYGKFLACPGFPECKNTKKIVIETKGSCPKCGSKIIQKKSQKGRVYYACERGKDCGFMSWYEPSDKLCPKCGKTLFKKKGKAPALICENEGCGFSEAVTK